MCIEWDFCLLRLIVLVIVPLDPQPPPTGITSEWLDRFTVMVSWNKADIVNHNKKILFRVNMANKDVSIVDVESGHECVRVCVSAYAWLNPNSSCNLFSDPARTFQLFDQQKTDSTCEQQMF